jgi:hypothetical protein
MFSFVNAVWLLIYFSGNPVGLCWDASNDFTIRTGYCNNHLICYVPFAASDMKLARQLDKAAGFGGSDNPVDCAPALSYALTKNVLGDVYYINGGQTAVFSSDPTLTANYTPLWRVHILEWRRGAVRTAVGSQVQVMAAIVDGRLIQVQPDSVLDATIVMDSAGQVIRQALEFDMAEKEIELPVVWVWYTGDLSRYRPARVRVILSDSSDAAVADAFGANYSPRLANALPDFAGPIWAFTGIAPRTQFPILGQIPDYREFDNLQINKYYNPILNWVIFDRGSLPQATIVSSMAYADYLRDIGVITVSPTGPIVTNSPVLQQPG